MTFPMKLKIYINLLGMHNMDVPFIYIVFTPLLIFIGSVNI